ncbi:MAG: DEAD/DEAH box helicase [Rhodospirillales bacterium]|nr:DEAD/DEAH box helicase [Rhodospirillales bacterium]
MEFKDLGLSEPVLQAIADAGYTTPTPIQEKAIPYVQMGRDVLGCAQTGTGKTASFTLPMIDALAQGRAKARMPRTLILEPTRELAAQVAENFDKYGKYLKLTKALLIGGVSMDEQEKALDRGVDVLIATPGRLMDLFDRGRILLHDVKILVIDEADRMLDMGFIPDVERIVSLLPPLRQTLFFSATMAPEIRKLADKFLTNPKEVAVSAPAATADTVLQGIVTVAEREKRETLRRLVKAEQIKNALVFCNRKRDVDILWKSLKRHGFNVGALHGDMDQSTRTETLEGFKKGDVQILCCSDVAARGLDIGGLSHVFNFDVPINAEDYVHRIGRTGRAGRSGVAYTIATPDDSKFVHAIERLIGKKIPPLSVEGFEAPVADPNAPPAPEGERASRGGRGGRERGGRGGRGRGRDRGERPSRAPHHDEAPAPAGAGWGPATEAPAAASNEPMPVATAPVAAAPAVPVPAEPRAERPARAPRAERPAPVPLPRREPQTAGAGNPAGRGFDEDGVPAFLLRGRRAAG